MALRGSNGREFTGLDCWLGLGCWFQVGKWFGLSRWLLLLTLCLTSCTPPPPPEGQLAIENVAEWFQVFRAAHRGKAPANEEEFFAFIQKRTATREVAIEREKFLTSPRDNQKYVVQYGKKPAPTPENSVVVVEKEGYSGKKLVAFESGFSREMDESEVTAALAAGN